MSKALYRSQLKTVINAITKYYPANYADHAWDNTGLLIDCSIPDEPSSAQNIPSMIKVLLTVDLTSLVAQEAIAKGCNMILAYHPFIFPSWKSLNPAKNIQQGNAIKLIQNGISVYCPHTAVDAAKGGVNDWLVQGIIGGKTEALIESSVSIEQLDSKVAQLNGNESDEVGYGRFVTLKEYMTLDDIIKNVKKSLGIPYVQVSSMNEDLTQHKIKTIALCAGSGSGVFKGLGSEQEVDLYYTGELSHHEILKYKEQGKAVIVCNHSNTERGYLKEIMSNLLKEKVECTISETDADPLRVV
ncbi:uncharacterized protein NDAI_0I03000 [Naumovozyma dairenensis CBS 421]|uniref:Uncharacterized protein n=1 Tax=Naumovozyma dairenensis (strain ATCC 10597 / BCRC 20456 / CBS 421 / NBRC 0211 / NRRL Y-12639) TaxID=1071378 RepID=G0WGF7_NAUDC|nr:hypothetical protein NDAI_0I03000 [Naumovozyma dairenensis CBS 421]CCD26868.1 hypothetical protein NDAI_0I03000 [Naumovozyma dairenensis CBS 421]